LGIVCDFNGSARTVSIDKDFFSALGLGFKCINDKPGQIAHRIVPEGESLDPCVRLLEDVHREDPSFVLGYVPDCDGDRGNLVIYDDTIGKARALEAQEVFALACVAELSHLTWIFNNSPGALPKAAIAINDPTSMRIDKIAECFGVDVFRAEVGEANVVSLARKLRNEGYLVRILGEGSAGGNITHPSAVRDPINTVLAIVKMLAVRSIDGKPGLFEIWCKKSRQTEKYKSDFLISDIIASLPSFVTTPAYNKDAVMRIKTQDHVVLKDRYQEVFLREWEEQKEQLKTRFGIYGWEAIAYNGITEKRGIKRFGEAGKGGLKILFSDAKSNEIAYIWMRGSATEPVFRIMADVGAAEWQRVKSTSLHAPTEGRPVGAAEGKPTVNSAAERYLLDWQRCMIMTADAG
ncbi:MAG: phosphatidylglycerol lysyltransferase, partial [Treponema sp.]|nr:phosphatidylglycerol lysyltransferase [Treponema sp.]